MTQFLVWWLASTMLGLMAFPIAWRVFSRLPDRGFGLSRALGILAAGYLLWLGATTGLLRNDLSGVVGAVAILGIMGAGLAARRWREMVTWAKERWTSLVTMELLFLAAFALWSYVRAANPEITATEKPMELAFLNSIMRSETFPPRDPWLSGYAISYYYFGYVLLAFLTRLTGVSSGVAFNLGNALWFSLVALGACSILYNLLNRNGGRPRVASALLAPLFVLLTGNLEGFLEVLHARQLFWRVDSAGGWVSGFWNWLGIKDLLEAPTGQASWLPTRYLWWWRASRVVHDVNLLGADIEVIDEFPSFSFVLADNHPHLLAMPFVLLAISLALQVFFAGRRGETRLGGTRLNGQALGRVASIVGLLALLIGSIVASGAWGKGLPVGGVLLQGLKAGLLATLVLGLLALLCLQLLGAMPSALGAGELLFCAWVFGSLAFLNTWDLPIYLCLLLAVIWWAGRGDPPLRLWGRLAATGASLVVMAVLLFLPWYPTFKSQAGGVLPNLIFPTFAPQFLVMFGTSLIPLLAWLAWKLKRHWHRSETRWLLGLGFGLPLVLLLISWGAAGVGQALLRSSPGELQGVLQGLGAADTGALARGVLDRRLSNSWTALLLGCVVSGSVVLVLRAKPGAKRSEEGIGDAPAWVFVAFLIMVGALLILGPEFLYLRDLFGTRMNTVFKFYFAGWILWGLAAAYAVSELAPRRWGLLVGLAALVALAPQMLSLGKVANQELDYVWLRGWGTWLLAAYAILLAALVAGGIWIAVRSNRKQLRWGKVCGALTLLPLCLGLVYTFNATWTKTSGFRPSGGLTLDGTAHLASRAAENSAIQWIEDHLPVGVIAEAVGGSYSEYARISTHTGFPTVLGWEFHEMQWRGSAETLGSRKDDIQRLYQSRSWSDALEIIARYNIQYVYVGPLERATYSPYLDKFEGRMEKVYENEQVVIFAMSDKVVR